ncbi:hypothetical protein CHARACLAT_017275 [Characodon lateralis]|uniref:Secreted protein n=1 Tax=Characodon lateralis TaxID=208331 RepID=A0ABU7EAE6_9TELE|nr:hypothetical protein [Characodon lateralis]
MATVLPWTSVFLHFFVKIQPLSLSVCLPRSSRLSDITEGRGFLQVGGRETSAYRRRERERGRDELSLSLSSSRGIVPWFHSSLCRTPAVAPLPPAGVFTSSSSLSAE